MDLTIILILKNGQHLHSHREIPDSVAAAEAAALAEIAERARWNDIDRAIVVAGDLSWKIDADTIAINCTTAVGHG